MSVWREGGYFPPRIFFLDVYEKNIYIVSFIDVGLLCKCGIRT